MDITDKDKKRLEKNSRISDTIKQTRQKRQSQVPVTYTLKVRYSKCNKQQKEFLKMIFVEGKWVRNYLLSQMNDSNIDIFKIKEKDIKVITHKDKDKNDVKTELSYLGSSMKKMIIEELRSDIKGLSTKKKQGNKTGSLKFKSDMTSIKLLQYGNTYEIVSDNRIHIQNCKKALPVSGLKQLRLLDKNNISYDIASATISHIDDKDYFINITVFVDRFEWMNYKESKKNKNQEDIIGVDYGCETTFTLSNGEKYNIYVEESGRLKRLQRKMHKAKKGSNNRYRIRKLIHKEYYKLDCKKDNAANQFLSTLKKQYKDIVYQDEQLNAWKVRHGKKVHHSVMGRVKSHMALSYECHMMSKWVPTTKLCRDCGHLHKDIKLSDREFICPNCGVVYDRDVHAAENMVWLYLNVKDKIGLEGSEFKREDLLRTVDDLFDNKSKITE